MKHKQVKVKHSTKGEIKVDAGIAPLLRLIWKFDIDTVMSCQCQSDFRGGKQAAHAHKPSRNAA